MYLTQGLHRSVQQAPGEPSTVFGGRVRTFAQTADPGGPVHAVVVLRPGATVTAAELRDFCKQRIAGYKAPRSAEFTDALPLSGAGKVLKRELRKPYWDGRDRAVQ